MVGISVAALISQFMAKHRLASVRDGYVLEDLIRRLNLTDVFRAATQAKTTWLSRRSSYLSWRMGLALFLLVNTAILILSIVKPAVFAGPPATP
ncbi:hypothetical protein [Paractinoplanes maris]|uniref:hypothetical protein n=1 Tax=Paractinoplanes maris TaxID=1734446 RepID=UPI0020202E9D|nr:hypothetical protein [Actinoplanes maris]